MPIRWDGKSLKLDPISREDSAALEAFADAVRERCIGPMLDSLHLCAIAEDRVRGIHRATTRDGLVNLFCRGCSSVMVGVQYPCLTIKALEGR